MYSNRLYIRADASATMGSGHIMRSIALGQAWQHRGGSVCFITHGIGPALTSRIKTEGFDHKQISAPCPDPRDLDQTLQFIGSQDLNRPDKTTPGTWLVMDGYHFTEQYQKAVRKAGYRLLVLDDYNHLPEYFSDLLVNQNPRAHLYHYNCSDATKKLMGTDYVLLRKEFLARTPIPSPVAEKATKILVTLGGADPGNITFCIVQSIQSLDDPDIEARVVVGPSNPRYDILTSMIKTGKAHIRLIENPVMPDLMEWADLAITAGGSTCWELCFMGVPFVVIPVAKNQINIAGCLEKEINAVNMGLVESPGDHEKAFKNMDKVLTDLINCPDKRESMAALGKDLVDGTGSKRVVRQMVSGKVQMLAKALDKENTNKNLYLFYTGHKPGIFMGRVKLTEQCKILSIGYLVKKNFQKLGLAPIFLENALNRFRSENQADFFCNTTFVLDHPPKTCAKSLTITLVSDQESWINPCLEKLFVSILLRGHRTRWVHHISSINASDIVFYLSCSQLAPQKTLDLSCHNIIVHGSSLPKGKGWSPISWQILEGRNTIAMTLFEAVARMDSGPVYLQRKMVFNGHELIDEIRKKTAWCTIDLCLDFLDNHTKLALSAKEQQGIESFYPKRTPRDSCLDPDKTIRQQFNLLRIADNENYPLFFTINKVSYKLDISRMEKFCDQD